MVEKVKQPARVRPPEEEASGVRVAPISPVIPRLSLASGAWGVWGEELARQLVAERGAQVLPRFTCLTERDCEATLVAATAQLVREGPPPAAIEARVRQAVFAAAVPVERRRWIEETADTPAEARALADELGQAARRVEALTGRERQTLRAVCALDDVAEEGEVGKVVLHAAVAYQMRWNTAHQYLSRAWRRIGEGGLASWCKDWRAGQRLVCPAPSVKLWAAARAYLDACNGRGGFGGAAFDVWTDAHEDHNNLFTRWKKQSAASTASWRAFVGELDGSGVRPGDVAGALLACCRDLGADHGLVPAKIGQQSWHDLLTPAPRPVPEARSAWRTFLRAHPFGPEVEAAFLELEREAALAEVASVELERAYKRLLGAAEQRSGECVRAKDHFRRLVDAL